MKTNRIAAFSTASPVRTLVEHLESRELLSVAPAIPAAPAVKPGGDIAALFQHLDRRHNIKSTFPIQINNVTLNNGQLVANGMIGEQPFTAPIDLSVVKAAQSAGVAQPAATTQILNLHLGPINLNLLGLQVTTSPICLDISATSGNGNLLGNLLTSIANLLNGGTPLGNILGGLTGSQLNTLLNGLTGLLNGLLGNLTAPAALGTAAGTLAQPAVTTNILHLSLGPVDLNLLGLNVHADNCSNGPITLDVNAVTGPGNLLGNLLNGLLGSLNNINNQTLAQTILRNTIRDVLQLA